MISLFTSRTTTVHNKFISLPVLTHQLLPKFRLLSSETNDPTVTRIRNVKRYFAFGLFGLTFVVAFTLKQRKKKKWNDLLSKTGRVSHFGKLVLYEYNHYMLPKPVLEILDKINGFEFRQDDLVLASFPKTGTTWLSEILWLLTNNLDYIGARKESITDRVPYLEWPTPGLNSIAKSKKKS